MTTRILTLLCLMILTNFGHSQQFELVKKNKTLFTNEPILFNLTNDSDLPKIFHITLEDARGNYALNHLVFVESSNYYGELNINKSVSTGTYLLRCRYPDRESDIYSNEIQVVNLRTFSSDAIIENDEINTSKSERTLFNPALIEGVVLTKGQPTSDEPVIVLQSRGETELFEYSRVDSSGFFQFEALIFGESQLFFCIPDDVTNSYQIELTGISYKSEETDDLIPFSGGMIDIPVDSLKKHLILQNFEEELDIDQKPQFELLKMDKVIAISDYQNMADTRTFVKEAVPFKKLRSKGDQTSLRLLNFENNLHFKNEALYMIDGFIVKNFDQILELELDDIENFKTANKSSRNSGLLGRFSRNGLLAVTTHAKDYLPSDGLLVEVIGMKGVKKNVGRYESNLANASPTENNAYSDFLLQRARANEKVLFELTRGEINLLLNILSTNEFNLPQAGKTELSRIKSILESLLNQ